MPRAKEERAGALGTRRGRTPIGNAIRSTADKRGDRSLGLSDVFSWLHSLILGTTWQTDIAWYVPV